MSRRRHEVGGKQRKPVRPKSGRRPARRRRSFMARTSTRGATLAFLGTAVLAIAGVAIAGAITSGGNSSVQPDAASTPSAPAAAPTPTHSKSTSPRASSSPSPVATHSSSPRPTPSPKATASPIHAVVSPKPTASQSTCPPAAQRVSAARQLLQHQDSLPQVTLVTAGPRQGLLGDSNASARTLTLYVRDCADEPTLQLASVWAYEAGQFIPVQLWDAAKKSKWAQLRGSGALSYNELKVDAASVYAYWQTGSVRYWQSPVPPPSSSELSRLLPYLTTS
jgi:hypothetical protein